MENPGTVGALLALAIGVVRLVETFAQWAYKKWVKRAEEDAEGTGTNGHRNGHSAKLDPETALALKEIHDTVTLKDSDGVPLVYWPRSQIDTQKDIAKTLQDISRSQDKMVDRLQTIVDNTRK